MVTTRVFVGSLVGSAVVSAAISGAATYYFTNMRIRTKYVELSRAEIAEARKFYAKRYKTHEFSDPNVVAKKYETEIERLGYASPATSSQKVTEVLDVDETEEESEESDEDPDEDEPYIIGFSEFLTNDLDHEQVSLTYFEEDDVLVDATDQPVPDIDALVGIKNLRFGHKSKDNNIVYIRNRYLSIDFEVARNKGNFAKDVLGFIEHSERRGAPRKFRREYE